MSDTAIQAASKMTKNGFRAHFSVGEIIPFVCSQKTFRIPFIGAIQPYMRSASAMSRNRGFTMIELVVTMIIAALIAAFVIPNIRLVIKDSRIATQINGLKADLNYARSEAVKRRTNVMVCPSTDGATCTGVAGDWKEGRLITTGGVVLRFREAVGGDDRILTVDGTDPVVFLQNGGTTGITTFTICDEQGAGKGKRLSLSQTGLTTLHTEGLTSCN